MSIVKTYGTVSMNIGAVPNTKDEFYKRYKGRLPNIALAWKEISKLQKDNGLAPKSKKESK